MKDGVRKKKRCQRSANGASTTREDPACLMFASSSREVLALLSIASFVLLAATGSDLGGESASLERTDT